MSDLYYCPVCLSTISEIKTAKANKDNRHHRDVLVMKCGYTYRAVLYSDIGEPVYEEESPCGQAEEYADEQRRTIDKITKQRDKLLKAIHTVMESNPYPNDYEQRVLEAAIADIEEETES